MQNEGMNNLVDLEYDLDLVRSNAYGSLLSFLVCARHDINTKDKSE